MGASLNERSGRILLLLGLVGALYALVSDASDFYIYNDGIPHGRFGLILGACSPDRFCEAALVRAREPASAAGVRLGDRLRFDDPIEELRASDSTVLAGDHFSLTLRPQASPHEVGERHITLTAVPSSWTGGVRAVQTSDDVVNVTNILTVLVSVFLMLRAERRRSVLLLGMGMAWMSAGTVVPFWWWRDPLAYGAARTVGDALNVMSGVMIFAFAMAFRRETSARGGAVSRWALWALTAASLGWTILSEALIQTLGFSSLQSLNWINWANVAFYDVGYILAFVTLAAGWREAPRSERGRYAYVMPAVVLIAATRLLYPLAEVIGGWDPTRNPVVLAMNVLPLAGLLLLVYAVLRNRVLDLGFVVNRTLVYAVVSALLLASFGLIEWAVDHFIPIKGREKNALVDAVIAVGVFLTFHRVRDVVEDGIERLFFRRWQRAEADLRRFVRESAFITEATAATAPFVHALSQFGEGAQAAVYLQDARGYAQTAGRVEQAAEAFDANLPAFVRLRADQSAFEMEEGELAGCLIAPMIDRSAVIGAVLLGPKPTAPHWRPDEIELVGWAARQVGFNLNALKIEALEAAAAALRQENAILRSIIPQPA